MKKLPQLKKALQGQEALSSLFLFNIQKKEYTNILKLEQINQAWLDAKEIAIYFFETRVDRQRKKGLRSNNHRSITLVYIYSIGNWVINELTLAICYFH